MYPNDMNCIKCGEEVVIQAMRPVYWCAVCGKGLLHADPDNGFCAFTHISDGDCTGPPSPRLEIAPVPGAVPEGYSTPTLTAIEDESSEDVVTVYVSEYMASE